MEDADQEKNKGSEGVSPSLSYVQKIESGITGIIVGILALIFMFFVLNYLNILPLSRTFPTQFSFLPHIPFSSSQDKGKTSSQFAMRIGQTTIPYKDYYEMLQYVQSARPESTREEAISLTNEFFIKHTILKKEAAQQGFPFSEETFQAYLTRKQYTHDNLSPGLRLEYEISYFKDQLFENTLAWYSAELFTVNFENVLLEVPQEEKNQRARAKIEEIRAKWVAGASFQDLVDEYKKDKELQTLNAGQGFALAFEKMNIHAPIVSAPELLEIIQKLQPGKVSEVITISDPKREGSNTPVPFAFAVVKVTQAHPGRIDSFTTWLVQEKHKTQVAVFVK